MSAALGSPFEVTGAAMAASEAVHLRIEGFEASVAYRAEKLRALLAPFGEVEVQGAADALWRDVRDVTPFMDKDVVVRMSIAPSTLSELVYAARNMFVDYDTRQPTFDLMADWGGGLVWVGADATQLKMCARVMDGDPTAEVGAKVLVEFLQSHCALDGGHATLIKAPLETRAAVSVFQPENPTVTALSAGLRAKFDPRGILNAGLMG